MPTTPTQLPVPSEKPQDLKFNAGKIDELVTSMGWTYTDRFGNKHYTIEGVNYLAQQVMNAFGYITLTGVDFDTGATVSTPNEVLFNPADNSYYKWTGSFASGGKVVPQGSTPESTGGIGPGAWLSVGDASVRPWVSQNFEEAEYKKLQNVSFSTGTKILNVDEVLFNAATGFYYQYKGELPVTVSPGSTPDVNWRCVGDANYPLTVSSFGADRTGGIDSSAAFQLMYDNMRRCVVDDGDVTYLVSKPLILSGYYSHVDFKTAALNMPEPVSSGLPEYINTGYGYAPGNVKAFVMTGDDDVRYFTITGGYLDAHMAAQDDRPVGIYIPRAVNYRIINVQSRGCSSTLWVKSGWRGTLKDLRGNNSIGHDFWYDATRTDDSGQPVANFQSATSLDISGIYSNAAGGYGYFFDAVDYSTLSGMACDGATLGSYRFRSCQISGSIGSENPHKEYIYATGGTLNLFVSFYDDNTNGSTPNSFPVMSADGGATVILNGAFRTEHTRFCVITGAGCDVKVPMATFWNGVTTAVPPSSCAVGSFLVVDIGRLGGGLKYYDGGVYQEVRSKAPDYNSNPLSLTPFTPKIARIAVTSAATSLIIPLYRLSEVFPNFNRSGFSFLEVLRIKVTSGAAVATDTYFAVSSNTVQLFYNGKQFTIGNGAVNLQVTNVTCDGNNLTIIFTGSVSAGTIIELSYM